MLSIPPTTASGVQLLMACLLYPIELYAAFSGSVSYTHLEEVSAKKKYHNFEELLMTNDKMCIRDRFYSALDAIIAMKKIIGVNTYCRLNNIDRRNFIAQRKDLERGWFQLSWLYPMVKAVSYTHLTTRRNSRQKGTIPAYSRPRTTTCGSPIVIAIAFIT